MAQALPVKIGRPRSSRKTQQKCRPREAFHRTGHRTADIDMHKMRRFVSVRPARPWPSPALAEMICWLRGREVGAAAMYGKQIEGRKTDMANSL